VDSYLDEIRGLKYYCSKCEWYSWENNSGDSAIYKSLSELKAKENYDMLELMDGDFDIYQAGFLVNMDKISKKDAKALLDEHRGFIRTKGGEVFDLSDEFFVWYWEDRDKPEVFMEEFGLHPEEKNHPQDYFIGIPLVFDRPPKAIDQISDLKIAEVDLE